MAFTLSSLFIGVLMLLSMLAQFFRAVDAMIFIQGSGLTVTWLDFMCLAYLFYVLYDFLFWLSDHRNIRMKDIGSLDRE